MQDVGRIHIHQVPYCCGRGGLDSVRFLIPTLLFSINAVGGRGVAALPFSVSIFCFVNRALLTLSDCVGMIRNMIKEILTLRGKKYGSLIFSPVYPAFP
jgi:hypothetical protein